MANMGIPISRHTIVTAFTAPPTIVHSNHGMSVVKRGYDRQAVSPAGPMLWRFSGCGIARSGVAAQTGHDAESLVCHLRRPPQ